MREVDIHEAAGRLSSLVEEMHEDEELLLTRGGERVAKLTPVRRQRQIRLGLAQGEWSVPDDLGAPTSALIQPI